MLNVLSLTNPKTKKKIASGIYLPDFSKPILVDDITEKVYIRYKADKNGDNFIACLTYDEYLDNRGCDLF